LSSGLRSKMTELLAVPLKRASDIDITRPLKNW
jgi:hypothetical protein